MEPSSCITGLYSKPSASAPNLTEIKSPNTKHEKFFSIPGRSNISLPDIHSSVESTPVVERSISVSSERGVDCADKNKVLGAESLKLTKEAICPPKPPRINVPEQIKIDSKEISCAEQKKTIDQVGPALLESKDTADFKKSQTGSDFLETVHSLRTSHALESLEGVKSVGKVPFDIPEQILKFSDADRKITQLSSSLKEIAFNISNYQSKIVEFLSSESILKTKDFLVLLEIFGALNFLKNNENIEQSEFSRRLLEKGEGYR